MQHNVFDLDAEMAKTARKPIDASWSPKKKKIVAGVCAAVTALAVSGGAYAAWSMRTPELPANTAEAMALLQSGKFSSLPDDRKGQYAAEMARLFRTLPEDERRKIMEDPKNREEMRKVREEMMDDFMKRYARGEAAPSEMRPPEGRRPPGDRPQLTEEERRQRMEDARNRMTQAFKNSVSTGNAQGGGLRGEFFKTAGFGGGRGPGGGGGGGGGRRG